MQRMVRFFFAVSLVSIVGTVQMGHCESERKTIAYEGQKPNVYRPLTLDLAKLDQQQPSPSHIHDVTAISNQVNTPTPTPVSESFGALAVSTQPALCKPNFHFEPSSTGRIIDGIGSCVYVYPVPKTDTVITYSYTVADTLGNPKSYGSGTLSTDPVYSRLTERVTHTDGRAAITYEDNFYGSQKDLDAGVALAKADHNVVTYAKVAPQPTDGYQLQFIVAE